MSVPRHIAIIMDGNGRWARRRKLPNIVGHREGVKTVSKITEACAKKGIEALTLYAFSAENWKRSKQEIGALMSLFEENLKKEGKRLAENGIKFNCIGRLSALPETLRNEIIKVSELTSGGERLTLTLAINYGGRQEIFDAARGLFESVIGNGGDIASLREDDLGGFLYTKDLPELDLIIRTSGEMRLSNFLLWQAAYAELYVIDTLWPNFGPEDLDKALLEFSERERRFGG